jgi:hypothetical protein
MTLVAIEETIRALIEHFAGKTVQGWTSMMVVLCLSNAALMIAVGILGEYVGRIYEEGKGRPLYVVADTWNIVRDDVQDDQSEGSRKMRTTRGADKEISKAAKAGSS